jgi:hypothetical protein
VSANTYISRRTHKFWQKMREWYPNKLPETAPEDFAALIDKCDAGKLSAVLADMHSQHVQWPPTFPQFAALFAAQSNDAQSKDWNAIRNAFVEKLIRRGLVTNEQVRPPWNWHGQGDARTGTHFRFTAVTVPAVGNAPQKTFQLGDYHDE